MPRTNTSAALAHPTHCHDMPLLVFGLRRHDEQSLCRFPLLRGHIYHRRVAQSVEWWSPKPYVEGLNPFAPAKLNI